jgi:hypothetical protein
MRHRKQFFIFLSFFIVFSGCCETKKEYYNNNNIEKEVENCFGEIDSTVKRYYKNGTLAKLKKYKNGKLEDTAKLFYENGKPRAIAIYKDGQRNGVGTLFHKNGNINQIQPFENGVRKGLARTYYKNGNLKIRELFKNDSTRLFYDKYNPEGDFVREMRKFKVSPQFDTVNLADTHKFSVKPYGPVDRYKKLIAKLYKKNIYRAKLNYGYAFKLGENYDENNYFLHIKKRGSDSFFTKREIPKRELEKKSHLIDSLTFRFSYIPKDTGRHALIGVCNFISRTNEETDVNNPEGIGKMFFVKFYVQNSREK